MSPPTTNQAAAWDIPAALGEEAVTLRLQRADVREDPRSQVLSWAMQGVGLGGLVFEVTIWVFLDLLSTFDFFLGGGMVPGLGSPGSPFKRLSRIHWGDAISPPKQTATPPGAKLLVAPPRAYPKLLQGLPPGVWSKHHAIPIVPMFLQMHKQSRTTGHSNLIAPKSILSNDVEKKYTEAVKNKIISRLWPSTSWNLQYPRTLDVIWAKRPSNLENLGTAIAHHSQAPLRTPQKVFDEMRVVSCCLVVIFLSNWCWIILQILIFWWPSYFRIITFACFSHCWWCFIVIFDGGLACGKVNTIKHSPKIQQQIKKSEGIETSQIKRNIPLSKQIDAKLSKITIPNIPSSIACSSSLALVAPQRQSNEKTGESSEFSLNIRILKYPKPINICVDHWWSYLIYLLVCLWLISSLEKSMWHYTGYHRIALKPLPEVIS